MAGRKKKGFELNQKLQAYLDTYELDDLNRANDLSSLRQLANFEIIIANLQEQIGSLKDLDTNSKVVKDLSTALRDNEQSYSQLQINLGIDRKKRQEEGNESVLDYITKLKEQAKKKLAARLKVLRCNACNLPLGKYYIYITEKGDAGAIAFEHKVIEPIKYTFRVECPRCHTMVETSNERESSS